MADNKTSTQELELEDLHPDHEKHLCHISGLRNMKTVGSLAKDAQFLCVVCGRAARNRENLCESAQI